MVTEFQQPERRRTAEERHVLSKFFYDHTIRKSFILTREESGNKIDDSIDDFRFSPGTKTKEGTLKQLLDIVQRLFGALFKRKEKEFNELIEGLKSENFTSEEEMLTRVVDAVYKFATDPNNGFSREELEQNYAEKRKNKIPINEILDCDTDTNDPHRLRVHLMGTSNFTLEKVREGFKILADKLANASLGSAIDQIETISMRSWIVLEKQRTFERLGFIVSPLSEQDKRIGHAIAKISKEKFIDMVRKF